MYWYTCDVISAFRLYCNSKPLSLYGSCFYCPTPGSHAGVPSLLLPPISELVSTYKTAEDVVEAKTIVRLPSQGVLQTIEEVPTPQKEQPPSTNSRWLPTSVCTLLATYNSSCYWILVCTHK